MAIDISRTNTSKPTTPKPAATPPLGATDRAADVLARIRAGSTTNDAVAEWLNNHSLPDDISALVAAGIVDAYDGFKAMTAAQVRERSATRAEYDRQLAAARAAATTRADAPVTLKISARTGVILVYGINGGVVGNLYAKNWRRILEHADVIRKFLDDHEGEYSVSKGVYTPPANWAKLDYFKMPAPPRDSKN